MATTTENAPRLLDAQEIALLVRSSREARQWSQETLAEIAKVTVRTVQRIEAGEPSAVDSRRALAVALGYEDPDTFNRPHVIPTAEELQRQQEEFEREHLILDSVGVTTGRQLATLFETSTMDISTPAASMPEAAQQEFATLLDYLRDYRDIASEYSEVQKLDVHSDLQQHLDAIATAGFAICAATRRTKLVGQHWADKTPWEVTLVYLATVPKGHEQTKIAVPRRVQL